MDYTVKATDADEIGMDHILPIDGAPNKAALVQKVMNGHFTEWNKMATVTKDRSFMDKVASAISDPKKKADIEAIVSPVEAEPIGEVIK